VLPIESLHYIQQDRPNVLSDQAFIFSPNRIALDPDEKAYMQRMLLWSAAQLNLARKVKLPLLLLRNDRNLEIPTSSRLGLWTDEGNEGSTG
jgi:hypothetical protein